ncbi:hypothetical protein DFH09DRAFT_1067433 [Mycena vulgaris]|nr:hypothetical protein DFH09DRAFT_1067433 [Mycena vulgaris]
MGKFRHRVDEIKNIVLNEWPGHGSNTRLYKKQFWYSNYLALLFQLSYQAVDEDATVGIQLAWTVPIWKPSRHRGVDQIRDNNRYGPNMGIPGRWEPPVVGAPWDSQALPWVPEMAPAEAKYHTSSHMGAPRKATGSNLANAEDAPRPSMGSIGRSSRG